MCSWLARIVDVFYVISLILNVVFYAFNENFNFSFNALVSSLKPSACQKKTVFTENRAINK